MNLLSLDIWDNELVDKIENLKNCTTKITDIILNAAVEFNYNLISGQQSITDNLIDFIKNNNITLHIVTGTHENYTLLPIHDNIKIYYWPTFWLTMLLTRLTVSPNFPSNISIGLDIENLYTCQKMPIKYPFITMNKAPKIHRALMLDMLAKHSLIDKGIIIWRELSNNYSFKYWDQKIMLRDQIEKFQYQETLPLEYPMSFLQLVTESDEQIFTLSEKTGMPLFFNKPFLVAGCKNFHSILKNMGFVLYEELFDYNFDNIDDITIRYNLIAENINQYVNKTPTEFKKLYDNVFEKCVYNKKIALRLATDSALVPNIWSILVKHNELNNITDTAVTINNFILANENEFKF